MNKNNENVQERNESLRYEKKSKLEFLKTKII